MQPSNCRECGKLFLRVRSDLCPECMQEEENQLRQVREYLREHPQATIGNVVEDLDIDQSLIDKWIEEERLTLKNPSEEMAKRKCPLCGREVKPDQTYCLTCLFKQLQAKKEHGDDGKPQGKGMHFKVDR